MAARAALRRDVQRHADLEALVEALVSSASCSSWRGASRPSIAARSSSTTAAPRRHGGGPHFLGVCTPEGRDSESVFAKVVSCPTGSERTLVFARHFNASAPATPPACSDYRILSAGRSSRPAPRENDSLRLIGDGTTRFSGTRFSRERGRLPAISGFVNDHAVSDRLRRTSASASTKSRSRPSGTSSRRQSMEPALASLGSDRSGRVV